jgi:hypothetical protein
MTMNTNDIRELNTAELDLVTGASNVAGYQFCVNGPAGTGLYPDYVDCDAGSAVQQLIGAFKKGIEQGKGKGGSPK